MVTAGAWINHVLGSVGVHIPVKVTQEQVTYFSTPNIKDFTEQKYLFDIISVPQLYHNEMNKVWLIHRYKTCEESSVEKINSKSHPINSHHHAKGSVLLKDNKSFGLWSILISNSQFTYASFTALSVVGYFNTKAKLFTEWQLMEILTLKLGSTRMVMKLHQKPELLFLTREEKEKVLSSSGNIFQRYYRRSKFVL